MSAGTRPRIWLTTAGILTTASATLLAASLATTPEPAPASPTPANGDPQAHPRAATVTIGFRAVSEDAHDEGRLTIRVTPERSVHAVVWEQACQLDGRADSTAVPADADQSWLFEASAAVDASGRPAVRLLHRRSGPDGPDPEASATIRPGGPPFTIDALAVRRNCHYDRLRLTISAAAR